MNERLLTPISTAELERRLAAVPGEMGARGLDALVMQNSNDWLGGYVKWFTDLPAVNGYPCTVIFYADDPMSVIEMGPHGGRRELKGGDEIHRGVGELLTTPAFTSVGYTDEYQAEIAVDALEHRGCRSIGSVGKGAMPYGFVARIEHDLGGCATFGDATAPRARRSRPRTTSSCARGVPRELRLYCHGQGYDLVERPLVRFDETMPLEESMNLAVHPGYQTASLSGRPRRSFRMPAPHREEGVRGVSNASVIAL